MKVQPIMVQAAQLSSGTQFVDALNALDVRFLQGGSGALPLIQLTPDRLITGLATSEEARLRLALIPLFLRRPAFAGDAARMHVQLLGSAQLVLACYYSAAYLLQQKYRLTLTTLLGKQAPLPDLFTQALGLAVAPNPARGLQELAARHALLSGRSINWLGTYEHAAQRFLAHLEKQRQWQQ